MPSSPANVLSAVDDYNVTHEECLTHSVIRTARGWSAEVRVMITVEIDGQKIGGERVIRIPLQD